MHDNADFFSIANHALWHPRAGQSVTTVEMLIVYVNAKSSSHPLSMIAAYKVAIYIIDESQ